MTLNAVAAQCTLLPGIQPPPVSKTKTDALLNLLRCEIPTAPAAERSAIEGLVEKCLAARGENCGAWEAEINARVARLYGLTSEEIKLVEESARK